MTATSSVPLTALPAFGPPSVMGLDDHTQGLLDELVVQWAHRLPRNIERMVYLDAKNTLDDLGVSLPHHWSTRATSLGCPSPSWHHGAHATDGM